MRLGTFLSLIFMVGFILCWFAFCVLLMLYPVRVYASLLCAYSVPTIAFLIYMLADAKTLEKKIFTKRDKGGKNNE